MDSIGFQMEGMKELEAKFAEMTRMDRVKFFASELNYVGNKVAEAMRGETPVSKRGVRSKKYASRTHEPGNLRRSIGKKLGGGEIPTVWVSLNRRKGYDAWYEHMVVGGKEYGGTKTPPNPIVRRTWDTMRPWIESTLKTRIGNKLKALVK